MNKKKTLIRSFKKSKAAQDESNPTVHKKIINEAGTHNCQYCPPWKHENKIERKSKRGPKKPKYKNHRG